MWLSFEVFLVKHPEVILSLFCATYVFTCQTLAEFPECWVKPAAELSMSTSDAFTVPCSQPSEYFPKPSLAWLLHSASSQVFAVACVGLHTCTHPLPTTVESSCPCPFPQLDFSPLFTPPYCSPSGPLFIHVYSPTTSFLFHTLPPFTSSSAMFYPNTVWWSVPPALLISHLLFYPFSLTECQL